MVADTNGETMIDSTSTAPEEQMPAEVEETTEQKTERAQTLFTDGKRALAAGSLATANEKLSEACTLYTQLYDAFAVECFEPHMLYGKALLELSRLEPGVFNNALEGVAEATEDDESMDEGGEEGEAEAEKAPTEDEKPAGEQTDEQFGNADELTEEQREEIHEQVEEALAENADKLDKGEMPPEDPAQAADAEAKEPEGEANGADAEAGGDANADEEEAPEEGASAEDGASADEPPAPETDSTDDTANNVPNLQLAWEVLDVARAVCDKQEKTDEWQQKKSEVLLLLGDVSIEDENYKQAIDDLAVCLDIQQKIFAPTDRRIAETLFQMARAFNLSFEFAKAAEYYKKAYDVIKLRVEEHEKKMSAGIEDAEEKASVEKELGELQALLPDIQMKVDDSLESAKNAELVKEQQAEAAPAPAFEDKETAASKPMAADISNLVRKPVKRSIEPDEAEAAVKRSKADEEGESDVTTTNGNGHSVEANGDNGHAATAEA